VEAHRDRRPRVLRTRGDVTEGIYGLVLATSVIAVSQEYESQRAGAVAVTVLVTSIVFWLAHVYARILARAAAGDRWPTRAEMREVMRHDWPLVEVALPLVLVMMLGVVGLLADRTAVALAVAMALVELALVGAYAAATSGSRLPGVVLSSAVAVALGSIVVLLKALAH
jgi:hypothetical protein